MRCCDMQDAGQKIRSGTLCIVPLRRENANRKDFFDPPAKYIVRPGGFELADAMKAAGIECAEWWSVGESSLAPKLLMIL